MNISAPSSGGRSRPRCSRRRILLGGHRSAYTQLPVAPLPRVDFPTIQVQRALPGASPETMASSVATPLERRFGRIAGPRRDDLDEHARLDVDHAPVRSRIATSTPPRATCRRPSTPPAASCRPTCRLAHLPEGQPGRRADPHPLAHLRRRCRSRRSSTPPTPSSRRRSRRCDGVGQVFVGGGQQPAVRVQVDPEALAGVGLSLEDVRSALGATTVDQAKGAIAGTTQASAIARQRPALRRPRLRSRSSSRRTARRPRSSATSPTSSTTSRTTASPAGPTASARSCMIVRRQPGANIIETIERVKALLPAARDVDLAGDQDRGRAAIGRRPSAPRSTTSS